MQDSGTLRLVVPQWQGGEHPAYPLGARMLAWLAPRGGDRTVEIGVPDPVDLPLPLEDGVAGRAALMQQMAEIRDVLERHAPKRIVIFGGDCLVDQAPFAWLNQRHGGTLGVLWLDAHPDVASPRDRSRAHTMVLGNLLGRGDAAMSAEVPVPLRPERVMMVGLSRLLPYEAEEIAALGLQTLAVDRVAASSGQILDWITSTGISHLAIHLDLDVLDPLLFRSQGFAAPGQVLEGVMAERVGSMTFEHITRIIRDVSAACDVVGLGITEHMPWDAINLRHMLARLPILSGSGAEPKE